MFFKSIYSKLQTESRKYFNHISHTAYPMLIGNIVFVIVSLFLFIFVLHNIESVRESLGGFYMWCLGLYCDLYDHADTFVHKHFTNYLGGYTTSDGSFLVTKNGIYPAFLVDLLNG
jgi:hypothetical protein